MSAYVFFFILDIIMHIIALSLLIKNEPFITRILSPAGNPNRISRCVTPLLGF